MIICILIAFGGPKLIDRHMDIPALRLDVSPGNSPSPQYLVV